MENLLDYFKSEDIIEKSSEIHITDFQNKKFIAVKNNLQGIPMLNNLLTENKSRNWFYSIKIDLNFGIITILIKDNNLLFDNDIYRIEFDYKFYIGNIFRDVTKQNENRFSMALNYHPRNYELIITSNLDLGCDKFA